MLYFLLIVPIFVMLMNMFVLWSAYPWFLPLFHTRSLNSETICPPWPCWVPQLPARVPGPSPKHAQFPIWECVWPKVGQSGCPDKSSLLCTFLWFFLLAPAVPVRWEHWDRWQVFRIAVWTRIWLDCGLRRRLLPTWSLPCWAVF